jgi:glycosyltransferase involved in cell wall biosynthesis
LPALYSAADLFIMPSTIECFPHVVLEALATKTPQIVTEVGGVREILPEIYQSFVVSVGEWAIFAQKIVQLLRDPVLASTVSEAGYARFRKYYALDVVVNRFVEMVAGS